MVLDPLGNLAVAVVDVVMLGYYVGVIGREVFYLLQALVAIVVVIVELVFLAVGEVVVVQAGGIVDISVVEGAEVIGDAGDSPGVSEWACALGRDRQTAGNGWAVASLTEFVAEVPHSIMTRQGIKVG